MTSTDAPAFVTLSGPVSLATDRILSALADDGEHRALLDWRGVHGTMPDAVLEALLWAFERDAVHFRNRTCLAVVVGPEPIAYGTARMFAIRASIHGVIVEVFTDVDRAATWLGTCHADGTMP